IIILEDPIEYVHTNKNSLISQRQIGLHSKSFAKALRSALREDPDVVLVGEMRDAETIALTVTAAEVGILILGTLHTSTAATTINRIIDVFPSAQQQQIRVMLAETMAGIICQQLVRKLNGSGRTVAYELLMRTPSISNLIREGKTYQIPSAIQTGGKLGMRLLDSHLRAMVESGIISHDEAIRVASDPLQFGGKTIPAEGETAGV
ncbi:MAG: ATPase, T2SS/T4P/T4SS family, partial [candidate division Zixibacteria bacterium]|nr:ATPase, T2SS/T4P/T4SS family [candidate division Zixibacteria bacterium]